MNQQYSGKIQSSPACGISCTVHRRITFCTLLLKLRTIFLGYVGFKVTNICFCDFRHQQSLGSLNVGFGNCSHLCICT
jgi:hypothetical protein